MVQKNPIAAILMATIVAGSLINGAARAADKKHSAINTYAQTLKLWTAPEQVQSWIRENFSYDHDRAIALSETQRSKGKPFTIYQPAAFYQKPTGICVDLSRFAVETLNKIAPSSDAKYLLIKFDPLTIKGNVLRMHWIASFRRDDKYYFYGDSRYPKNLYGPYDQVSDFITAYQDVRGRRIITYRLVNSFRKERRKLRRKKLKS